MTPSTTDAESLLSLSELARKLNISYPRAMNLHAEGKLVADFLGPNVILFRPERVTEFRSLLTQAR